MFTTFDKAIAGALSGFVAAGLSWVGAETGVTTPDAVISWGQAVAVALVGFITVWLSPKNKA